MNERRNEGRGEMREQMRGGVEGDERRGEQRIHERREQRAQRRDGEGHDHLLRELHVQLVHRVAHRVEAGGRARRGAAALRLRRVGEGRVHLARHLLHRLPPLLAVACHARRLDIQDLRRALALARLGLGGGDGGGAELIDARRGDAGGLGLLALRL